MYDFSIVNQSVHINIYTYVLKYICLNILTLWTLNIYPIRYDFIQRKSYKTYDIIIITNIQFLNEKINWFFYLISATLANTYQQYGIWLFFYPKLEMVKIYFLDCIVLTENLKSNLKLWTNCCCHFRFGFIIIDFELQFQE